MKIAFLGSRGIPARYSGFETFYEELAVRLVRRGHAVTVYTRSHFTTDVRGDFKGVRLVSLPSINTKHLDTITHTALSSFHACFQGYDIAYYCIVGNSPLVWLPAVFGATTFLNVDGADWAREKWSGFARWYQRQCEHVAAYTASVLIADSRVIKDRYRALYNADTVFVPYGANVSHDERLDVLTRWGLRPREYLLYVGRLVPENAIDLLIRAYQKVATRMKLVIVGDAPFTDTYKAELRALAGDRVVFMGYAFNDDYAQISSHAYLAVQPSAIDGTRPALLDQMGFGNCIVVRNSPANVETMGGFGELFDGAVGEDSLAEKLRDLISDKDRVEGCRQRVSQRVRDYYNWEWITDFYEDLFCRVKAGRARISYDEFLQLKKLGSSPEL